MYIFHFPICDLSLSDHSDSLRAQRDPIEEEQPTESNHISQETENEDTFGNEDGDKRHNEMKPQMVAEGKKENDAVEVLTEELDVEREVVKTNGTEKMDSPKLLNKDAASKKRKTSSKKKIESKKKQSSKKKAVSKNKSSSKKTSGPTKVVTKRSTATKNKSSSRKQTSSKKTTSSKKRALSKEKTNSKKKKTTLKKKTASKRKDNTVGNEKRNPGHSESKPKPEIMENEMNICSQSQDKKTVSELLTVSQPEQSAVRIGHDAVDEDGRDSVEIVIVDLEVDDQNQEVKV